ncbi:hypothetical protein PRZ48_008831 [Zasmidium cellare]|uniref:Uncharacterized protein n=1 Tax=Zasmidium cellare TaxID=395010 RepID=A0ABR0EGK7_ZASCE|nr:hypothetical protein PRZ48_008831 [Zasmidium cellare]
MIIDDLEWEASTKSTPAEIRRDCDVLLAQTATCVDEIQTKERKETAERMCSATIHASNQPSGLTVSLTNANITMSIETAQLARRVKPTLITIKKKEDPIKKYLYIHDRIEEKIDSFDRASLTQEREREVNSWVEIFFRTLPEDEETAAMLRACKMVRKARRA